MEENRSSKVRKANRSTGVGIVFILLCVIGIISLIQISFSATKNILANVDTKHKYEEKLFPIVMFDPPTFENPATLREIDLMMYSIWSTVLGENRDKYSYDDNMSLIVPASDVDMTAYKLFGNTVSLSHKTFNDFENSYEYDEQTKSYHVPMIAMTAFYVPRVDDIIKSEDKLFLKVGYIPPKTIMNVNFDGKDDDEQEPTKYMVYEFRKDKKDYHLYAIRDGSGVGNNMGSGLRPSYDNIMENIKNQINNNVVDNHTEYTPPISIPENYDYTDTQGIEGEEKGISGLYAVPPPPDVDTTVIG